MLKEQPEDFIVIEEPINFTNEGNYFIYKLTKTNSNLHYCLKTLSIKLNIPLKDIGYAGIKDRRAITTQYISLPKKIENKEFNEFSIEFITRNNTRLNLGDLKSNKFIILLRNYTKKINPKTIIPNYFDEQRFQKNNVKIGLLLLQKKFKEAVELLEENCVKEYLEKNPTNFIGAIRTIPRRQLLLYIHSVQSKMFNELLSNYISNYKHTIIKYSEGNLNIPLEKIENKKLPLPGFEGDYDKETNEILKKFNLKSRDFIIRAITYLSSEGDLRNAFIELKNLEIKKTKEGTLITFSLPKGSYATIAIKTLLEKSI